MLQKLLSKKELPQLILLLIILVVGAYLRLYRISEYMTFLGDEGRDALVVKRMIVDGKFTLLGPTASVGGFFLGPIYYYFMAPFLWLWRLDPTGPAVMVALFGIATIFLVYRLGKEMFTEEVGLIAASLYAVSPVVLAFSRSSWNPNVVPFFSTLLILLLWRLNTRSPWALWLAGVALGIGLQLHYLFTFLIAVTLVWIFFLVKAKSFIQSLFWLVAGFVVGYSPFLLFELRHSFPNTQTVIRFVLEGKDTGFNPTQFWQNISDVTFRLFGRLVFRLPQPEWWERFSGWQLWIWTTGIQAASIVGLVTTVLLALKTKIDLKQKRAAQLLLLWYAVPTLLFGFYRRGIYDYYFGIFFALPFVLVALTLVTLSRRSRWLRFAAILAWLGLLFLNWQGRPFLFPPNQQLAQARQIAAEALAKTEGRPFNFALITGQNSDHAYRYFFEIWANPPVVIENEVNDPRRQTVTEQLIVICELPASECQPLGHPLWEIAGFGQAEIVGEWEVSFVKIFKLVPYQGKS